VEPTKPQGVWEALSRADPLAISDQRRVLIGFLAEAGLDEATAQDALCRLRDWRDGLARVSSGVGLAYAELWR